MALARSRRLGITESPTGFCNRKVEKGGHFRPAKPAGAMTDSRRANVFWLAHQQYQYQNFLILVLLDEK
jgi:hypothetical protein